MADCVTITEHPHLALASLIARRNCVSPLREAIRARWGADPPATPRIVEGSGVSLIWTGPARWLAASPNISGEAFATSLREAAGHVASICDQSDSRLLLAVSGRNARHVLAKGIPIDLDPAKFGVGDTAITLAGQVGCQIWQADDLPTYVLAVPRSYGGSLRAWLAEAAGELAGG